VVASNTMDEQRLQKARRESVRRRKDEMLLQQQFRWLAGKHRPWRRRDRSMRSSMDPRPGRARNSPTENDLSCFGDRMEHPHS
jgi:hypothetical protein